MGRSVSLWEEVCIKKPERCTEVQYVSRQKSSLKKVFGNKVLYFSTKKVLLKKSPRNKKCLEIKSYHFIFWNFFPGFSMILYKNVPGKKFHYSRECMVTNDVYNNAKKVA